MIRIKLNGQSKALDDCLTVDQLVSLLKLNQPNIAVAINYDVIPRQDFPEKKIKDGDEIDILRPVAGG